MAYHGDEESAPLIDGRAPEESNSILETIARTGTNDDVQMVTTGETQRSFMSRKSTLVLEPELEEQLGRTAQGRAFLAALSQSIMGNLLQVLLLVGCLGVYTFTPILIDWSKQSDRGLTVQILPSGEQDDHIRPILRLDHHVGLDSGNWPETSLWTGGFQMAWTGTVQLPATNRYGQKHSEDEPTTYKFWIASETEAYYDLRCDGPCPDRSSISVKSEPLLLTVTCTGNPCQFRIRLAAFELPAEASEGAFMALVTKESGANGPMEVPSHWLQMDREVDGIMVETTKSKPYLDASIVVVSRVIVLITGSLIAYYSGGMALVHEGFAVQNVLNFAPVAICYAVADTAEILANSGLDPTVYIVLSQSRLILTALTLKIVMDAKQTTPQWIDLTVLTFLICIFQFTPADFLTPEEKKANGGDAQLGLVCTFVKIACSVIAGVIMQKKLQASANTPFAVQLCSIHTTGLFAAIVGMPITCWLTGTLDVLYEKGPFGGRDYPYTWDTRTFVVVFAYQCREWLTNLVVKRFDALVKNLCNAGASLCSFLIGIFIMGKKGGLYVHDQYEDRLNVACVTKIMTITCVLLLVGNYSIGKLYVKAPVKG